ncbi:hypothetical protein RHGRI_031853 [Rhododendron griersonianum]|uniref:DNA/RNA-binding protein Alba-like domain-containing protein n=1 Tax=Rhododendron griersonianum TaxID=479676 RepID=A0AAV6I9H9_9ERIC|nr:hypothetical protein RHGRI_031853 [Rhododendron griersonianum]
MDRYQRVEKPRAEMPINENEIRITTQGRMRNYITYATTLLQEKGSNEIALKAMGRAINKTVMIAELIKIRIADLHQNTSIGSTDITDMWEPLEEGLLPLETTRHVSVITITLAKKELDTSSAGYQPPIPADQVKPWNEYDYEGEGSPNIRGRGRGGRGRGRGRGRGSMNNGVAEYNGDGGWDGGRGYGGRGRGQSRGRGRGYRGRGRGYGGGDMQQDFGGYNGYGGSGALPAQTRYESDDMLPAPIITVRASRCFKCQKVEGFVRAWAGPWTWLGQGPWTWSWSGVQIRWSSSGSCLSGCEVQILAYIYGSGCLLC